MTLFLSSLPLWLSTLLMVGISTVAAMSGTFLVRRRVTLERLILNNEVAGFKFATVGVIYAVLLAFAVIVVWEKFSEAERAVESEAGGAATLYRLVDAFPPATAGALEAGIGGYLDAAIHADWPAMATGRGSPEVATALDALYRQVILSSTPTTVHPAVVTEMFRQLDDITHARRVRLYLSTGVVPSVIWAALTAGAALTVAFTFFFGTRNVIAQVLMTGALTAMTSVGLLVIVSIDYPFSGPVRIGPHPLEAVLDDFNAHGVRAGAATSMQP